MSSACVDQSLKRKKNKAAFESSQIEYAYELSLGLMNLMVGSIWKLLFAQNQGRAESQLVLNNFTNISFSVSAQL